MTLRIVLQGRLASAALRMLTRAFAKSRELLVDAPGFLEAVTPSWVDPLPPSLWAEPGIARDFFDTCDERADLCESPARAAHRCLPPPDYG